MKDHQQATGEKRIDAVQEPSNINQSANDPDTIYLEAEVIEPPYRRGPSQSNANQGNSATFSTFAWSSLDGFQRGWNSAYDEKRSADPFANDMTSDGPKTSKSEWKRANITGGLLQTIAGGAVALAGIPMLILPGPGLLAIGLGGALAASGIKKMLGR